jgi:ATP-dependent helicase/nuclease subunit A
VLQTVDLRDGTGLASAARAHALAEGVPERVDDIAARSWSILRSPVVRSAVRSRRWWREVPVGCAIDGVTLEGFVDLLWESTDGLVVVDYKTDNIGTESRLGDLAARYSVQGAAYALALQQLLEREVARVVLVFAGTVAAREVVVPDLPTAIRGAAAMVRATGPITAQL